MATYDCSSHRERPDVEERRRPASVRDRWQSAHARVIEIAGPWEQGG